jgi:hypothetical protein
MKTKIFNLNTTICDSVRLVNPIWFWRRRGPATLSGGAAFLFPFTLQFAARACTSATSTAWSPCVFSAQLLKRFGDRSVSEAAIATVDLAGRTGQPASLPPPPLSPPAKCTAETGSCFGTKKLLGDWFADRIRSGGTGFLGCSAGGKLKFTTAMGLADGEG